MKIKRYKKIQEYVMENNISQEESQKIMIERPSEIVIFNDESNIVIGSLHLWHNRPDYNGRKTSYIGNVNMKNTEKMKSSFLIKYLKNLKKRE